MKRIHLFENELPATPIAELNGDFSFLTGEGTGNRLFIKRDDMIPFSFGGNKARKAACFYEEIVREEPDIIMTYGTASSNHCRIIANMAAALGLPCHVISPLSDDPEHDEHFNKSIAEAFGAVYTTVPVTRVHDTIENIKADYAAQGKKPYFIMGGGHGDPGTKGYVKAYEEIRAQEKTRNLQFDYIFHASGTGATQAGLITGKLLENRAEGEASDKQPEIVGISIARACPGGRNVVVNSVKSYLGNVTGISSGELEIGAMAEAIEKETVFDDSYILGGYGKYDGNVEEVIKVLMESDGIPADTTYVGKAFTGMLRYIKEHDIRKKNILFVHTGGTPLYFDYLKQKK